MESVMTGSGEQTAATSTLVLTNCHLVNVYSGEIGETDVTIVGERITSIARGPVPTGAEVIDCRGRFVVPGLIDAHMHVDTTFLWPGELARAIVPLGTTTLFVDTSNNAHTGGIVAIEALRRSFVGLPLRGYIGSPSYCPFNAALGTAAVEMTAQDFTTLAEGGYASIGETVWTRMVQEDHDFVRGVQSFREAGLRVSGHGGEIRAHELAAFDAYVSAGIQDDHCIGRAADIIPRMSRGLRQFMVECTGRRGQLKPLLEEVLRQQLPLRQICFSIDNNTSMDIVANRYGYMDYLVRIALELGIPPVEAYRMATLNAAEHHRVSADIGAVAPGRLADILVLDALDRFPPHIVIVGGKIVAREGTLTVAIPKPDFDPAYLRSIHLDRVQPGRLSARAFRNNRQPAKVMEVIDGDAFNKAIVCDLPVRDGAIMPDVDADVLKIIVVERYGRKGTVGVGFAKGFGLKRGAMATSISVPFNNIVAVGASDGDLWDALHAIEAMQGGFAVVADGKVLAEVPLRVGGIMSLEPYESFLAATAAAEEIAHSLGCQLKNPFKTLVSTVHTTLPDLGLTDLGLIDTRTGTPTSLVVESVA
jgi:adenine deaminase